MVLLGRCRLSKSQPEQVSSNEVVVWAHKKFWLPSSPSPCFSLFDNLFPLSYFEDLNQNVVFPVYAKRGHSRLAIYSKMVESSPSDIVPHRISYPNYF